MKVRFKLTGTLLLILLVSIIVLSVFYSARYSEMICTSQISAMKINNTDKSAFINEYIRNIIASLKSFTSDENIRIFTAEAISDTPPAEDLVSYTNKEIRDFVKKNENVSDMFIMDTYGLILAANNPENIGTVRKDYAELKKYCSEYNGISPIFAPDSGSRCYFYSLRRIYSTNNQKVGIVCQKIDFTEIGEMLKITGYSNYGSMMIVDSAGKYVTGSVAIPKPLEAVKNYRPIAEHLADVIPFYNQTGIKDTISAEFDNYNVCGTVIPTPGWSIISVYELGTAKAFITFGFNGSSTVLIITVILSSAALVFVCYRYTMPIKQILDVIAKKNKGDSNVSLEIESNDEFGRISTEFNTMFDSIFESEQRYRTVVSMTDNIVFEINLKTFKVYVSDNFNQKFSFRASSDGLKESFLYKIKVHKDDAKRYRDDIDKIVSSSGDKLEGEYRLKNIYGDFSWIRIRGVKFFDRNKTPSKIIGMMVDIDREKKSAISLIQKASYDALTQLYNRPTFMRTLDEEMQQSVVRRSLDALMFIDLDDFKHFNDEYGHKVGDEVLKFVADTIKEITFDKGFGGRLGGDEFVMCLTNLKLIGDAGSAAQEMINILDNGFISESCGEKFNIHCSIGIAFFRENGGNSAELLESADTAMYKIKKSGKSNFAYAGGEATATQAFMQMGPAATFDSTFLR